AGDDGDLEYGTEWENPRFTDNLDGAVTDNNTGLIWLRDANCLNGNTDWPAALAYCNGLSNGMCGLLDGSVAGDWRLPNLFELESLLDMAYVGPALSNEAGTGQWEEGHAFTDVESGYYWSSTTRAGDSDDAWRVRLTDGAASYDDKTYNFYVWPVR
ncbi:MAG: DUF1566 domain-containing protein, partial [Proteobacteria bacterium]|nr:DUF1566 domain-containing protein [Pseudomonadota bacterium]